MSEHQLGTEGLVAWTGGLDDVQKRIGPRFSRAEQRRRVVRYVNGLLSPIERTNGWQLAEHADEMRPSGMQRLADRSEM